MCDCRNIEVPSWGLWRLLGDTTGVAFSTNCPATGRWPISMQQHGWPINSEVWKVSPSWADLVVGVRPNLRNAEVVEPASSHIGWQHEAAASVEWQHRERVLKPVLSPLACTEWPSSGDEFVRSRFESTDQDRITVVPLIVFFTSCFAFVPMSPSFVVFAIIVHLAFRRGFWEDDSRHKRGRARFRPPSSCD